MIPLKFKTLINALSQKTITDNAKWIKTSNPTEYKIRLNNGFITIAYNNDLEGKTKVELNVYNIDGEINDSLLILSSSEDYNMIIQFYNEVNSCYNRIDPFFNELLNEISFQKKIGNNE